MLTRQYPLFTYAARVLSLADSTAFEVYTSPIRPAVAFHFAEKKSGAHHSKRKIAVLTGKIKVATTDETIVRLSVNTPAIEGFEDGLEYYTAIGSGCEAIITEDKGDFYFSRVPVYSCEDFLKQIRTP